MHKNNFIVKEVPMPEEKKREFMEYLYSLLRQELAAQRAAANRKGGKEA